MKDSDKKLTPFQTIYDAFLSSITDDMYMEWTEEETYDDIKNIFLSAMSGFQFPRFKLYDYHEEGDVIGTRIERVEIEKPEEDPNAEPEFEDVEIEVYAEMDAFNTELTREEINIFAHLMLVEWVNRQLASVDVTKQAYGSRDFEFTSQANHLDKLIKLKESFSKEATRLQRLYTRRKMDSNGFFVPNYRGFGGKNNAD
jgi:hypothetical protein